MILYTLLILSLLPVILGTLVLDVIDNMFLAKIIMAEGYFTVLVLSVKFIEVSQTKKVFMLKNCIF